LANVNIEQQILGELLKEARDESRKLKLFSDSDEIRILARDFGISFEDTKGGTILVWK